MTEIEKARFQPGLKRLVPANNHCKVFYSKNINGQLEVQGLSISIEDTNEWVRGWEFSFKSENTIFTHDHIRYVDHSEFEELLSLKSMSVFNDLGKMYTSKDGIDFIIYEKNQRILWDCFIGAQSESMVDDVLLFMTECIESWGK